MQRQYNPRSPSEQAEYGVHLVETPVSVPQQVMPDIPRAYLERGSVGQVIPDMQSIRISPQQFSTYGEMIDGRETNTIRTHQVINLFENDRVNMPSNMHPRRPMVQTRPDRSGRPAPYHLDIATFLRNGIEAAYAEAREAGFRMGHEMGLRLALSRSAAMATATPNEDSSQLRRTSGSPLPLAEQPSLFQTAAPTGSPPFTQDQTEKTFEGQIGRTPMRRGRGVELRRTGAAPGILHTRFPIAEEVNRRSPSNGRSNSPRGRRPMSRSDKFSASTFSVCPPTVDASASKSSSSMKHVIAPSAIESQPAQGQSPQSNIQTSSLSHNASEQTSVESSPNIAVVGENQSTARSIGDSGSDNSTRTIDGVGCAVPRSFPLRLAADWGVPRQCDNARVLRRSGLGQGSEGSQGTEIGQPGDASPTSPSEAAVVFEGNGLAAGQPGLDSNGDGNNGTVIQPTPIRMTQQVTGHSVLNQANEQSMIKTPLTTAHGRSHSGNRHISAATSSCFS